MHLLNAYLTTPKRKCTQIINPSNEYVQHTATSPIVSASIGLYSLDSTEATLPQNTKPHTHTHKHKKLDSVHQVTSLPQFTMFHFSIPLLTVDKNILDGHVACTHEIVPDAASFHYALRRLCSILHSGEQYLKPGCRGVFYHSPDLWKGARIITNDEERYILYVIRKGLWTWKTHDEVAFHPLLEVTWVL